MGVIRTYLEFASEFIHVASVLIEVSRVAPDEAHLIFEGVPGLEICDTGRGRTAMNALDALLHAFQRYRVSDGFVILFELSCRQIDEWRVDLKAPSIC